MTIDPVIAGALVTSVFTAVAWLLNTVIRHDKEIAVIRATCPAVCPKQKQTNNE